MNQQRKQKILIADDSEMNRSILADMLGEEYEIIEAENGVQAVSAIQKFGVEIALVLLDIVMPEMDGFGVLTTMNQYHWIEDIPVIMISAEHGSSQVERAYKLRVTDFISRPFDALIVHQRVVNTILLYSKQKKLVDLVADQIYEKEQASNLMIDILSHIVEFRNGESGMHVVHVRVLTELLLRGLMQKTDKYPLTPAEISLVGKASALHDVGKISIAAEVLNKPGKLTDEEFAIMKTHSMIGAEMLGNLPLYRDEPLIKTAYAICRWHHERYDGRGYPDGLKGDEIPIAAQVVSMADVYDALTSERVYKKAFPHEKAIEMIVGGECGAFNPLILETLQDVAGSLEGELQAYQHSQNGQREVHSVVQAMQQHEELTASERTLQLLEHERMKFSFFASLTEEIQFEFSLHPAMVTLSSWGASRLGLEEIIMDPINNEKVRALTRPEELAALSAVLRATTPGQPVVRQDCTIVIDGEPRWFQIVARAMWTADEPPRYAGAIGKAIDVHASRMRLAALEQRASHDALTGLLNHAYAKERIQQRIEERGGGRFALAMLDLDYFKSANDTWGHMFGDRVLKVLADLLRDITRSGDIVARVGGDEFLIFLEYSTGLESIIHRIHGSLSGQRVDEFTFSVSMGVAATESSGGSYDALFHAADQALYTVKRSGRGHYRFYDHEMQNMLTMISPIDSDGGAEHPTEGEN